MSLIYDGGVVAESNQPESFRRADFDCRREDVRPVSEERHDRRRLRCRHRDLRSGTRTDDQRCKTHHMNVDYSAYEGTKIKGVVETVLSRGKVIVENGRFKGKAGDGTVLETRSDTVMTTESASTRLRRTARTTFPTVRSGTTISRPRRFESEPGPPGTSPRSGSA